MRRLPQHKTSIASFSLAAVLALVLTTPAGAIAPAYVSDDELAHKPIIVVARWPKAIATRHDRIKGNVVEQFEVHTELAVERVIRGDITVGRQKLLLGWGVGWQKNGTGFGTYTSTEVPGDIYDVSKSNLWFLSLKRSWDRNDGTVYLSLDTYRGVQPLEFEPFYVVLQGEDPHEKIGQLLKASSPAVVLRALEYIDGGTRPWPFRTWYDDFVRSKPDESRRLARHAAAVEGVLDRKQPELREMAAATYAELAGKESIPRMRQLLGDRDPVVRTVAVGVLARHRDNASVGSFSRAVVGIKQAYLACAVVEALAGWSDPRVVPALINFLQNDDYAGQIGDDIRIPTLKAQAALQRITGCSFPCDVRASQKAWTNAQQFQSTQQRIQSLRGALGDSANPLQASAGQTEREVWIKVTNRSRRTIYLTRRPFDTELRWDNGVSGGPGAMEEVRGRDSFLRLAPGESVRWSGGVAEPFTGSKATLQQVTLLYARHGHEFGVNAWIGVVRASVKRGGRHPSRYTARAFSE